MKNFDKLLIQQITIEVNRQCNFKCEHCFCGESEGFFDFNYEKLCLLLDQTLAINYIDFIGGEPTLSIDIMMNVIKECEKRNIPISHIMFNTNGSIINDEFCDFIIYTNKYIQKYLTKPLSARDQIYIYISNDFFHSKFIDIQEAFKKMNNKIGKFAKVILNDRGTYVEKIGRAENLSYALESNFSHRNEYKLPILVVGDDTNNKHYHCTEKLDEENLIKGMKILPCQIAFSGKTGRLYNGYRTFISYAMQDKMNGIEITDNIIDSINKYNETVRHCDEGETFFYDKTKMESYIDYLKYHRKEFIEKMENNGYGEVNSIFSESDKQIIDKILAMLSKVNDGYIQIKNDLNLLNDRMSYYEKVQSEILERIRN